MSARSHRARDDVARARARIYGMLCMLCGVYVLYIIQTLCTVYSIYGPAITIYQLRYIFYKTLYGKYRQDIFGIEKRCRQREMVVEQCVVCGLGSCVFIDLRTAGLSDSFYCYCRVI